jgi:hypothetical protein
MHQRSTLALLLILQLLASAAGQTARRLRKLKSCVKLRAEKEPVSALCLSPVRIHLEIIL